MRENDLFILVRSTLLAGLAGDFAGVEVQKAFQPDTAGAPQAPSLFMQNIGTYRDGAMRRTEILGTPDFTHRETQWWRTTLQIGAMARLKPEDLVSPTAMDIAKRASDILQGDNGLAMLAAQRVRPLRVTTIRNVQFVNESDQYEQAPSFDIVLSHVEITDTTTPPVVTIARTFGRV